VWRKHRLRFDEVTRFFESIPRVKQRAILTIAYDTGLCVSEAVHLKVADIDNRRMMICVNHGKFRKDNYVILSPRLPEILRFLLAERHRGTGFFQAAFQGGPSGAMPWARQP